MSASTSPPLDWSIDSTLPLPLALIITLAIVAYLLVLVAVLLLRMSVLVRGRHSTFVCATTFAVAQGALARGGQGRDAHVHDAVVLSPVRRLLSVRRLQRAGDAAQLLPGASSPPTGETVPVVRRSTRARA